MTPEGTNPEVELSRFLNPERTRFTDGDRIQERGIELIAEGLTEEVEEFYRRQLGQMEHPLERAVCRHWLRTLAADRGDTLAAAELSEAQIDDLLEGGRPESAASEAATAAAFYNVSGAQEKSREVLTRGYDCLRIARKNADGMTPAEAATAQGVTKRLLDDVRKTIGS